MRTMRRMMLGAALALLAGPALAQVAAQSAPLPKQANIPLTAFLNADGTPLAITGAASGNFTLIMANNRAANPTISIDLETPAETSAEIDDAAVLLVPMPLNKSTGSNINIQVNLSNIVTAMGDGQNTLSARAYVYRQDENAPMTALVSNSLPDIDIVVGSLKQDYTFEWRATNYTSYDNTVYGLLIYISVRTEDNTGGTVKNVIHNVKLDWR